MSSPPPSAGPEPAEAGPVPTQAGGPAEAGPVPTQAGGPAEAGPVPASPVPAQAGGPAAEATGGTVPGSTFEPPPPGIRIGPSPVLADRPDAVPVLPAAPPPAPLAKFRTPAALVLLLILLFLPFVTVSCETPAGEITASYSGVDLVTDGAPSIDLPDEVEPEEASGADEPITDVGFSGILMVLFMLAAIGLSFLREARLRLLGVAGATTLAAAMLIVSTMVAVSNLKDQIRALTGSEEASALDPGVQFDPVVNLSYGFWFVLLGLVGLAIANIVGVTRAERAIRRYEEDQHGALPLFDG